MLAPCGPPRVPRPPARAAAAKANAAAARLFRRRRRRAGRGVASGGARRGDDGTRGVRAGGRALRDDGERRLDERRGGGEALAAVRAAEPVRGSAARERQGAEQRRDGFGFSARRRVGARDEDATARDDEGRGRGCCFVFVFVFVRGSPRGDEGLDDGEEEFARGGLFCASTVPRTRDDLRARDLRLRTCVRVVVVAGRGAVQGIAERRRGLALDEVLEHDACERRRVDGDDRDRRARGVVVGGVPARDGIGPERPRGVEQEPGEAVPVRASFAARETQCGRRARSSAAGSCAVRGSACEARRRLQNGSEAETGDGSANRVRSADASSGRDDAALDALAPIARSATRRPGTRRPRARPRAPVCASDRPTRDRAERRREEGYEPDVFTLKTTTRGPGRP